MQLTVLLGCHACFFPENPSEIAAAAEATAESDCSDGKVTCGQLLAGPLDPIVHEVGEGCGSQLRLEAAAAGPGAEAGRRRDLVKLQFFPIMRCDE